MNKDQIPSAGRIRPLVLGILILVLGLITDKWWWQLGLMIIAAVFIEAFFRYRPMP